MNLEKNFLMKRLQNGETMDSIASEITDLLNEVAAEYAKSQSAALKRAQKEDIANRFRDLLVEYATIEYPELIPAMTMTEEDVDMMIDTFDGLFNSFKLLAAFSEPELKKIDITSKQPKSDDEVLSNFISSLLS